MCTVVFLKESDTSLWRSQTKLNFEMNESKLRCSGTKIPTFLNRVLILYIHFWNLEALKDNQLLPFQWGFQ